MMTLFTKKDPILKTIKNSLIDLPAPINISLFWNLGSLLIMCLMIQIITGLLLTSIYSPSFSQSFYDLNQSMTSSDYSWLIRYTHANGASLFFICMYIHIGRGIYYKSFSMKHTWFSGVTIFLITMATAFLGYVLPLNQMSFWGASVITNLLTEVPFLGPSLIKLVWGGVSVAHPTVTRFFMLHFLLPFVILALVLIHIITLHKTGSSNPMGLSSFTNKIKMNSFFIMKDLMGFFFVLLMFSILLLTNPLVLGDDENFNQANPLMTPRHIQPEWYFLFAYAILRAIPNKLGGVMALALSVLILYYLPYSLYSSKKSFPLTYLNFSFLSIVVLLTWVGMCPVEPPFIFLSQILTLFYFSYFIFFPWVDKF